MSDDRLDQLDYYTLLRLSEDAAPDAIRRAFHAFARQYHPDNYASGSSVQRERAETIYRRGTEALRVLSNPEARRLYDRGLAQGQLRFDPLMRSFTSRPPSGRPGRLGSSNVNARPFVVKAEEALRRGDAKAARLHLQIALQHDPENGTLAAELRALE